MTGPELELEPWIRCPKPDHGRLVKLAAGHLRCASCDAVYPRVGGRPAFARAAPAPQLPEAARGRAVLRPRNDRQFVLRQMLRTATGAAVANWRGRVLDIGCGDKPYASAAPGVSRWFGIDLRSGPEVDLVAAADELPFAPASFDHVFCSQVLEHLEEPGQAIAEMVRVTVPGGTLFLSTPQTWPLHEEPRDFYRFTPHGLTYLAEAAGYVEARVVPCGGSLVTLVQLGLLAFPPAGWLSESAQHRITALSKGLEHVLRAGSGNTLNNLLTAVKPAEVVPT